MKARFHSRFTKSGGRKENANGKCLATNIIRHAPGIFSGMGVYTVNEVFFLAGM